jgi:hypothetical protein
VARQASAELAGLQGGAEFYPYVFLSISLDDGQDFE